MEILALALSRPRPQLELSAPGQAAASGKEIAAPGRAAASEIKPSGPGRASVSTLITDQAAKKPPLGFLTRCKNTSLNAYVMGDGPRARDDGSACITTIWGRYHIPRGAIMCKAG